MLTLSDTALSENQTYWCGGGVYNNGTMTVTGGILSANTVSYEHGGGIYNDSYGDATFTDSAISGNTAPDYGGGAYNAGTLTIIGGSISDNSASSNGGGIINYSNATLTIIDCSLSGNTSSSFGGGIYNYGTLSVAGSTLSGNSASNFGGGIYTVGTATIAGSTLSGNSAQYVYGGGIYNNGTLTAANITLSGNSAGFSGGGICNFNVLTLNNSTISGNWANSYGGGIYSGSDATTLNNTIVAGNAGGGSSYTDIYGPVTANYCLIQDTTTDSTISGSNNELGDSPWLGTLGYYGGPTETIPLLPNSPAIDHGGYGLALGVDGNPLTTDQRGLPRVYNGIVDIGAYESQPMTLVVDTTTDESNGNYGPGDLSLREAVELANVFPYTTITFAPSLAGQTIVLANGPLELTNTTGTTTITGPGASQLIISGNNSSGVFQIDNGVTADISDLTIADGNASDAGGGIYNEYSTLTVTNCTITGNSAYYGGGIYNNGMLTVTGSIFSENSATYGYGGGIYNEMYRTLTVTGSAFSGNSASYGGGIFSEYDATATVADCSFSGNLATEGDGGGIFDNGALLTATDTSFSGNSAYSMGGGVYSNYGTLTVAGCTFVANSAASGGGIFNYDTATVTNSTVSGNSATSGDGGGIYNSYNGTATITDCTISGNSATYAYGGGIANDGDTVTLDSTIVAGNTCSGSPDIYGLVTAIYCLIEDATGTVFDSNSTNNITGADPLFGALGDYGGPTQTIPLLPGSPAIGAADSDSSTAQDQRGVARDASPDIGAFESQGFTISLIGGDNQQTTVGTQFADSLVVEVTSAFGEPVEGGQVTFTSLGSDAGAILTTSPATIDKSGQAQVAATANDTTGSYTVSATAAGSDNSALFNLTNVEQPSLVVTTDSDVVDPYDGLTSLREAIDYAATLSGDVTVTFDMSQVGPVITLGSELDIDDTSGNITIAGPGADQLIISGDNNCRVFQVEVGVTAYISDLTISDGSVSDSGGGIYNFGTLTVADCTLSGNVAEYFGGGIYNNYYGTLTLSGSTLSVNSASDGGGIYTNQYGTVTLTDSTLSGNYSTSGAGGGIYSDYNNTLTISGSTLSVNSAMSSSGGGIYSYCSAVTITDSTLSGNSAYFSGSGVFNESGTLTVTDSTFSGNVAQHSGGGIFNDNGSATVAGSTLSGNSAGTDGSGVYNDNGTLTVAGSTLSGNAGSGIFNSSNSTLTITASTLSGNSANVGGGILNYGTATIAASTLSGNSGASFGGGVFNDGTLTVTDSTLSGNSAIFGGGIFNYTSNLTVADSTLSGNSATSNGGGIWNESGATLTNTIVAGNTCNASPDIYGPVTANYCLIKDATGTVFDSNSANNITGVDPLLGALGDYGGPTQTIPLLPGSPAIDAADPDSSTAQDQRGVARDASPDIGAFESQGFTISLVGGDNQQTTVGTQFANSLVVEVASAFGEPVEGGQVAFVAPATGPSATFSGGSNTETIDSSGQASIAAQANLIYGDYAITASASGAAPPAAFQLTNNGIVQTISFDTIGDQVYGAPAITLQATATSGFSVTFSLISGPATLAGDVLSITGVGTVVVEAAQDGDETYLSANPVDQSFERHPGRTDH